MSTPPPPGPDPQGSHHWIMTASWPTRDGEISGTWRSTYTPEPGQTRAEIYELLREWVMRDATDGKPATVLFFSLEPNQLGGDQ